MERRPARSLPGTSPALSAGTRRCRGERRVARDGCPADPYQRQRATALLVRGPDRHRGGDPARHAGPASGPDADPDRELDPNSLDPYPSTRTDPASSAGFRAIRGGEGLAPGSAADEGADGRGELSQPARPILLRPRVDKDEQAHGERDDERAHQHERDDARAEGEAPRAGLAQERLRSRATTLSSRAREMVRNFARFCRSPSLTPPPSSPTACASSASASFSLRVAVMSVSSRSFGSSGTARGSTAFGSSTLATRSRSRTRVSWPSRTCFTSALRRFWSSTFMSSYACVSVS